MVRQLVHRGANIESRDCRGCTPLLWAAQHADVVVARILIEGGADVESRDNEGYTPIFWATRYGKTAVVRRLVDSGASIESRDSECCTPLLLAARTGKEAVVRAVMEKGANIEATDNEGCTPLLLAARFGKTAVVRTLIANGANIESTDKMGCTPLMFATLYQDDVVMRLLSGTASIKTPSLQPSTVRGQASPRRNKQSTSRTPGPRDPVLSISDADISISKQKPGYRQSSDTKCKPAYSPKPSKGSSSISKNLVKGHEEHIQDCVLRFTTLWLQRRFRYLRQVGIEAGGHDPTSSFPFELIESKKRKKGDQHVEDNSPDNDDYFEQGGFKQRNGMQAEQLGYACPYFKYNPTKYKAWRSCTGPGWPSINRLK